MVNVRLLYELEALDAELEAREEALARVEGELGRRDALTPAEEAVAEAKRYLQDLEKEERDRTWELDDLQHKIRPLDQKLYSGRVTNPKELADLHHEVTLLLEKRRSLEDRVLGIMEKIEDAREELRVRMERLMEAEAQWHQRQEALRQEQQELVQALESLRERRQAQAARIPPPPLQQYQEVRQRKRPAVARLEQGMCQGCRIGLPVGLIQRARGQELVLCPSCTRILYLP